MSNFDNNFLSNCENYYYDSDLGNKEDHHEEQIHTKPANISIFYLTTDVLAVHTNSTNRNSNKPNPINSIYMMVNAFKLLHSHIPNAMSAIAARPKIKLRNLIIRNKVGLPALMISLAMMQVIYLLL